MRFLSGIIGVLLLAGCGPTPIVGDSTLLLGTDDESSAVSQALLNAYETNSPNSTLTLDYGSRTQVIEAVQAGELDAGFIFMPPADSTVFSTPIGQDSLVLITHPDNAVEGLESGQVRDVFTGRVLTWSALGGADAPITLVTYEAPQSGRLALEQLLQGFPLQSAARIVPDSESMLTLIASIPFSFGYVAYSQIDATVQPLAIDSVLPTLTTARDRSYPFLIQIVLIARREPEGAVREFLEWILSPDGQRVVRRYMLGFDD